jgi:eukaryotic-like serine/threonine-protein kinase
MSLTPGVQLGPYQILAPLGAGGMGEVYRARDPRLGREVAIKVLPAGLVLDEERLHRFEQEARAASSLNHPNILTVHDVGMHEGSPYLVTELLQGQTLRDLLEAGPLPLDRAADYARQLASGLAAAHDKAITHRDLKPENIFVTEDGRVKILDFGLAKLRPSALPDAETATMPAMSTKTGMIVGTIGYMSPEQVEGKPLDHRTDLFSLGVVLFEMVTGRRAFPGNSLAALVAIMHEDPPPASALRPDVPGSMTELIRRCLAKDPGQRIQSARELLSDLDARATGGGRVLPRAGLWIAAALIALAVAIVGGVLINRAGGSRVDAVAVLPFASDGEAEEVAYLAAGLTDGLIAQLAQIGSLKVISRSSGELAEGANRSIRDIAKTLGVGAVVRGSLRRDRDSVRVTVTLLRAADGAAMWKKDYSGPLEGLSHIPGELALAIAGETRSELGRSERDRLERRPDVDRRAYDAYLRGRFYMEHDDLEQARAMFEQARAIAPDWAPSYVGLANYYTTLPFVSDIPPVDVLPKARAAVVKALELDETLAEAHSTHAYILAYYEWDWQAAEKEFRRALALQPSYADAHFSYSRFLASRGRLDESIAQVRQAVALDPLTPSLKANSALLDYFSGRYQEAYAQLQSILQKDSTDITARWGMALVQEQLGRTKEAIGILEPISRPSLNRLSSLGHVYGVAGRTAEARAILDTLHAESARRYVPAYWFALVHAGLGERDEAAQWLERAYQERSTILAYVRIDPRLQTLRDHPRFIALVQHLGGD